VSWLRGLAVRLRSAAYFDWHTSQTSIRGLALYAAGGVLLTLLAGVTRRHADSSPARTEP